MTAPMVAPGLTPAVSFRWEQDTFGAKLLVCEVCQAECTSEGAASEHEDVPHHTCPQCGEDFSDTCHPDAEKDFTPVVVGGRHYCGVDCVANELHDAGITGTTHLQVAA